MSDDIIIEIPGLAELNSQLEAFGAKVSSTVLKKAVRAAGEIVLEEARMQAPVKEGTGGILPPGGVKVLLKSKVSVHENGVSATILPTGKAVPVVRWLEEGHRMVRGGKRARGKNGWMNKGGEVIGQVDPHPFLAGSLDASASQAVETFVETLKKEIESVPLDKQGN
jgi:HK97 gp10 family phage protein